ncbi:MAG: hypothetical protein R3F17_12960 [Planctomycetota bacterium]
MIVGRYFPISTSDPHAFRWDGQQFTDLGQGWATAISDTGFVSGHHYTAWVWSPISGVRTDLGTLGGNGSQGLGINNQVSWWVSPTWRPASRCTACGRMRPVCTTWG